MVEWKACFAQAARDFCENTSLHGFQYLVEDKRSKIEKYVAKHAARVIPAVFLQTSLVLGPRLVDNLRRLPVLPDVVRVREDPHGDHAGNQQ